MVGRDYEQRMLKAINVNDLLEMIRGTDLGDYLSKHNINDFNEFEEKLWQYIDESVSFIKWLKPVPKDMLRLIDAYLLKYDILNIKTILAKLSYQQEVRLVPLGQIHSAGRLNELEIIEDMDSLNQLLRDCELDTLIDIMKNYQPDAGAKARLVMEVKLEREYYRNLKQVTARMQDKDILAKVIAVIRDTTDIKVLLRAIIGGIGVEAKEYIISQEKETFGDGVDVLLDTSLKELAAKMPYRFRNMVQAVVDSYEKNKDITVVEEMMEQYRFRELRNLLSTVIMSPLLLLWYLLQKEIEIKNVRIVAKALFDKRGPEENKNSLVMLS